MNEWNEVMTYYVYLDGRSDAEDQMLRRYRSIDWDRSRYKLASHLSPILCPKRTQNRQKTCPKPMVFPPSFPSDRPCPLAPLP